MIIERSENFCGQAGHAVAAPSGTKYMLNPAPLNSQTPPGAAYAKIMPGT
jgi:hypothetical protein